MTFVEQIIPGKIKGRRDFFSSELLEEMFVTVLSQIGFASDLEVLSQKLLIDAGGITEPLLQSQAQWNIFLYAS